MQKFTTGLSLKFKVMYQVVTIRLTHWRETFWGGIKEFQTKKNFTSNHTCNFNFLKSSFLKSCTSKSATHIFLSEMNEHQDKRKTSNTNNPTFSLHQYQHCWRMLFSMPSLNIPPVFCSSELGRASMCHYLGHLSFLHQFLLTCLVEHDERYKSVSCFKESLINAWPSGTPTTTHSVYLRAILSTTIQRPTHKSLFIVMCYSIYFTKQLLDIQYCHILPLTE